MTTAHWFDPLFTTPEMRMIFSDGGRLSSILQFERGLARAQASLNLIPPKSAELIASKCQAQLFDFGALMAGTKLSGNSAIPIVKALTDLVKAVDPKAANYVHWGATSQDAMDTGLVLQIRDALDLLESDLRRLASELAKLTEAHRRSIIVGRTWLQHATPITFGLKVAGWLSAIHRHIERLHQVRRQVSVLQFGGASGGLGAWSLDGWQIAARLADELHLTLPELPWHAHRDRLAEVATTVGIMVGCFGKIARDVSLMSQTEIREVSEPAARNRGGSSSMPHKQNPIGCASILSAAIRVPGLVSTILSGMIQEHERGLGGWQAEWDTLPEILLLAAGALNNLVDVMAGLHVDPKQMEANLRITQGQVHTEALAMRLATIVGREQAHALLERACRDSDQTGRSLRDCLAEASEFGTLIASSDFDSYFDTDRYLSNAELFIDRVLARNVILLNASIASTER